MQIYFEQEAKNATHHKLYTMTYLRVMNCITKSMKLSIEIRLMSAIRYVMCVVDVLVIYK